jgi:hypothetical protein
MGSQRHNANPALSTQTEERDQIPVCIGLHAIGDSSQSRSTRMQCPNPCSHPTSVGRYTQQHPGHKITPAQVEQCICICIEAEMIKGCACLECTDLDCELRTLRGSIGCHVCKSWAEALESTHAFAQATSCVDEPIPDMRLPQSTEDFKITPQSCCVGLGEVEGVNPCPVHCGCLRIGQGRSTPGASNHSLHLIKLITDCSYPENRFCTIPTAAGSCGDSSIWTAIILTTNIKLWYLLIFQPQWYDAITFNFFFWWLHRNF